MEGRLIKFSRGKGLIFLLYSVYGGGGKGGGRSVYIQEEEEGEVCVQLEFFPPPLLTI